MNLLSFFQLALPGALMGFMLSYHFISILRQSIDLWFIFDYYIFVHYWMRTFLLYLSFQTLMWFHTIDIFIFCIKQNHWMLFCFVLFRGQNSFYQRGRVCYSSKCQKWGDRENKTACRWVCFGKFCFWSRLFLNAQN